MASRTAGRTVRRTSEIRTTDKPSRRTSGSRQKSFSVRTDPLLKKQVDIFLENVGMSMSTAINLYLSSAGRYSRSKTHTEPPFMCIHVTS